MVSTKKLNKKKSSDLYSFFLSKKNFKKKLIENDKNVHYSNNSYLTIPDLVNIQRNSFKNFVVSGLYKALKKKNNLVFKKSHHKLEILFFPECIQFKKPEIKTKNALYLGKTYGCSIYIPVLIKFSGWKKNRLEWLFLGFLPLITKQGHFIINGIPRVVLHQMIRNPGVYILSKDSRTRLPTIRIVPEQGSWLNITVDKKNRIWITTRILRRKISVLIFLQALGLSLSDIFNNIGYYEILKGSLVKSLKSDEKTRHDRILLRANLQCHPLSQKEAQRYLYAHFLEYTSQTRDQIVTDETSREFFWKNVWNSKNRNIGYLGRKQFCDKLGSTLAFEETQLSADDIGLATKASLKLLFNEQLIDDIDSLNNKRIRGCGEFLYDELNRGLQEFELVISRKFSNISGKDSGTFWRFNKSLLSKCVSKAWKSFFTGGTLSQFMDETNPLAETTHKRRITVLGPGGVSSKQTTIQIRGIHPTSYGRLCPIETPEGGNAGLVNSFTVYTQRNSQGSLETPFFTIYKGQVQKEIKVDFMSPYKESSFVLAPADISISNLNKLPKTYLPVRKNWKFEYAFWNKINKQSVGLLQMISVATSLIPFLEHDDANRALMGSNMQRQAVPLLRPEGALVSTGLETRVICDINHAIRASHTGYVTKVSSNKIELYKQTNFLLPCSTVKKFLIRFPLNKRQFFELKPLVFDNIKKGHKLSFSKLVYNFRVLKINSFFNKKQKNKKFFFTHLTFSKQKKKIKLISHKNLLQSLDWNFSQLDFSSSDNIVISDFKKPFSNDLPPSTIFYQNELIKIKKLNEKNYSYFLDTYQRTNQSTWSNQRSNLKEGDWIQKSDIVADGAASYRGKLSLGKNVLLAYLPWEGYNFEDAILISEKLVEKELFTSLHIDYYEIEVKNTQYGLETITNTIPLEIDATSKDIERLQSLNSNGLIEIGTWVQEGDYLVGKITPLSPKGPSVQQQYEKLFNVIMQRETTSFKNTSLRVPKGVEGFVLDVQILPPKEADVLPLAPKNAILRVRVALLQKRNLQVGDKMAGRHGNKGVISKILPAQDMPYLPDGNPIDIVLNPLGVPSRMNVGQILECLLGLAGKYLNESYQIELFDEKFGAEASRSLVYSKLYEASLKTSNPWLFEPQHPGKIKLFDGRTGEAFDQPVTVGYAYMLKLIHLVDDKIHARATGPYSAVTQQPVKGRARNGGQRLGEMEVWALQAYGAAYTLQELLTIKSDDIDGRQEAVFRIYTNRSLKFGQPESFKVLLRELQALCFNLQIYKYDKKMAITKQENLKTLETL